MLNRRLLRGERHPNAKLKVDDVLSIRRMARYGDSCRDPDRVGISGTHQGPTSPGSEQLRRLRVSGEPEISRVVRRDYR